MKTIKKSKAVPEWKQPWSKHASQSRQRCNNENHVGYKNYGGRGIKCLILVEGVKFLWFRDKAYLMKYPTIDRIDNDGNYTLNNCQFIEKSENVKKRWSTKTHCSNGHLITSKNTRIKPCGSRVCRICAKLYIKKYRKEIREVSK